MALPEKYTPTFVANTGDDMIGDASPETLTSEFTIISKFFDPTAMHDDNNPGGIHKGNLATESGIVTEDNLSNYLEGENLAKTTNTDIFESDGVTVKKATLADTATLANEAVAIQGKTIGNGNGNVPLSNGTLCTNLNTEYVNGFKFRYDSEVVGPGTIRYTFEVYIAGRGWTTIWSTTT